MGGLWTIFKDFSLRLISSCVRRSPAAGPFHLLEELDPQREAEPPLGISGAIQKDFGGFQRFRKQLPEVASTTMGSGWAALVWEPIGKRLLITQIYDHQSNLAQAGVPLWSSMR